MLCAKAPLLLWREDISACIREEASQTPCQMSDVEPDCGGTAWTGPELVVGESPKQGRQVFTHLQQGVRDWL